MTFAYILWNLLRFAIPTPHCTCHWLFLRLFSLFVVFVFKIYYDVAYPHTVFFSFSLLRVLRASCSSLMFFICFGKYSASISSDTSSVLFSLSFWDSVTYKLDHFTLLHMSLILFSLLLFLFLAQYCYFLLTYLLLHKSSLLLCLVL